MQIPENFTIEDLDSLAESMTSDEAQYVYLKKSGSYFNTLKEKIKSQMPSFDKLISEYSVYQYFEQTIEVSSGFNVKLRTVTPKSYEESVAFASKETNGRDPVFSRVLSRMRASYSIVSVNGNSLGPKHPDNSYFDLSINDPNFGENMKKNAIERYKVLENIGVGDKIVEVFGIWDTLMSELLNNGELIGEALKNSKRTPAKEA